MVISVSTVIMGVAVSSVVMLMEMYGAERAEWESSVAKARLQQQFRDDARSATKWNLEPNSDRFCRFELSDGSVATYQQVNDAIIRTSTSTNQKPSRERYAVLPDTHCRVTVLIESDRVTILQLTIDRPADGKQEEARRQYETIVSAGADKRYSTKSAITAGS